MELFPKVPSLQVEFHSAKDLPELGDLHEILVKLVVVPITAEVKESSIWVVNSVKGFDACLELIAVHTATDLPNLNFVVDRSFFKATGRRNKVFVGVDFAKN